MPFSSLLPINLLLNPNFSFCDCHINKWRYINSAVPRFTGKSRNTGKTANIPEKNNNYMKVEGFRKFFFKKPVFHSSRFYA